MSLTVTREYVSLGNKAASVGTITFDTSYPVGGEAFDPLQLLGINNVDTMLIEGKEGYTFEFDKTNKKIRAMAPRYVPPVRYEEKHTMDSTYKVELDYPAAYIMNVSKAGQGIPMRSTGVTPAANQCALVSQLSLGVKPTLLFDAGTPTGGTLLSNGTFTGNATGWTAAAGWTYGSNAVAHDGAGTGTLAEDAFAAVVGRTYEVSFEITTITVATGGVTASLGGVTGTNRTTTGTYTERFTATSTAGFALTPGNTAWRGIVDNISVIDCDVFVTYVTQAWREVWKNLVQDEVITFATGDNALTSGNRIAALMYIDQTTATATRIVPVDEDDTVASGECEVAFNVTTNVLKVHADQNEKAAKVTYIKVPTSGFLKDRLFHNEAATHAGGDPYTDTFDYPILIWGYSGCVPANGQTTKVLIGYADTPATGEAVVDWYGLGARGAAGPAVGTQVGLKDNHTCTGAGIWGRPWEIPVSATHDTTEAAEGEDLTNIGAVRFVAIGV